MRLKVFEVRDRATFILVFAIKMGPQTEWRRAAFLRSCGYPTEENFTVIMGRLDGKGKMNSDAYDWGDRTYKSAHIYIENNFDDLEDGAVVDVEFILGETKEAKRSELR